MQTEIIDPIVEGNARVDALEQAVLQMPQVDLRTTHALVGGIYARTIELEAGFVLTGATHKKDHVMVMFGDLTVTTDEGAKRFTGYHVIPGKAGVKRAGFAHSRTTVTTFCATNLTDIDAIEDELVVESARLQTRQQALTATIFEALES